MFDELPSRIKPGFHRVEVYCYTFKVNARGSFEYLRSLAGLSSYVLLHQDLPGRRFGCTVYKGSASYLSGNPNRISFDHDAPCGAAARLVKFSAAARTR